MRLPLVAYPHLGLLVSAAAVFALSACKRPSEASTDTPSAPPAKAETVVAVPAPLPPPIIGWTPDLQPGETVIDVAGFAAVLTRKEIPARENEPFSGYDEYAILTKDGQRLGPWRRVAAFAAHENDTYHAYVSTESYGELTPLGLAAENPNAYPAAAGPYIDEPSGSGPMAAVPGVELQETEGKTTLIWQGKELGTWSAICAITRSPDGADLYFWAQGQTGGWDVFRNGTALTQPDPQRTPVGDGDGEFAPRFVFGSKPGEVAYAESLGGEQDTARFGSWMVSGQKRWGPYMGFSPSFVWATGAHAPSFAAREGMTWVLTADGKTCKGAGNYTSVDWFMHDTAAQAPIWSAKVSYSQSDEHQLLVGDTLILRANAFGRPIVSADGATLAFTAWYRPKSVFSMNSSTFVVLLPRSLHYAPPAATPPPDAPDGNATQAAADPLAETMRRTLGILRFLAPPHAGPYADTKNLRLSAGGRAVAFDVERATAELKLPEPHVFDGKADMVGHLDADGCAATLFKDGTVIRQTGL
ncbi:MAG TPA: hypothetical protein PLV33_00285 [Opitutaceae bacterium]|nr:hypothetical protein [Opitutaceae bacterium]HOR23687.1 hypothetical protein [Opitutaceae bacterium]HPK48546.1 hypothetical protein [Opitutaceae bacterium]